MALDMRTSAFAGTAAVATAIVMALVFWPAAALQVHPWTGWVHAVALLLDVTTLSIGGFTGVSMWVGTLITGIALGLTTTINWGCNITKSAFAMWTAPTEFAFTCAFLCVMWYINRVSARHGFRWNHQASKLLLLLTPIALVTMRAVWYLVSRPWSWDAYLLYMMGTVECYHELRYSLYQVLGCCLGVLSYLSTSHLEIWPMQMQFAGDSDDSKFRRVVPDADPSLVELPPCTHDHRLLDYDPTGVYPELPLNCVCTCKAMRVQYRGRVRWAVLPDRECIHNHLDSPVNLRLFWDALHQARAASLGSTLGGALGGRTVVPAKDATSTDQHAQPPKDTQSKPTDVKGTADTPVYDDSKYSGPKELPHYMHKEERNKLSLPETIGAIMATVARVVVPTLANADMSDISNRNALVDWCSRNFATYEQRAALYSKHMQAFTGGRWGQWSPADIGNAYHFCVAYCTVPTNGKIAAAAAEKSKVAKDRRSLAPTRAKGQ